ncbi:MAG: FMN-binding protein [Prevotella sp.]|nr:FMN-binding protein [Prevotella sp.]
MRKRIAVIATTAVVIASAVMMLSAMPSDNIITKEEGMDVVNTTSLSKNVTGYIGTTPLKIYIKRNKVVKIVALRNQETPKYFAMVKKQLLDKWNGLTLKQASKQKVDAVTGATYSSNAVIKNVQLGLDYYQKKSK